MEALRELRRAVDAHKVAQAAQSAIDLGQSALDLELRHRLPVEIDTIRFELWTQQLRIDAASEDDVGVTADVAALEWIRDRFEESLDPAGRSRDRRPTPRPPSDSRRREPAGGRRPRSPARRPDPAPHRPAARRLTPQASGPPALATKPVGSEVPG